MNRTFSDGSRRLWSGYQPLTNTLIAASVLLFLGEFARLPVDAWLQCVMPAAFRQPWRLFTYPLLSGGSILSLLFGSLMLWQFGGSLERSWGTRTLAIFLASISVITALGFAVAALFTEEAAPAGFLVLAALVVAWCVLNADETLNLYGLIPIKSRYLAAGGCVVIFFLFGWNNPIIGLLALSGCGFAVLWVKQDWTYRVMSGRAPRIAVGRARAPRAPHLRLVDSKRPKDDRFTPRDLNPVRWLNKRNERRKFEKLMRDD